MIARRRRSLGAWVLAAATAALFGACVFAPDDVKGPCAVDSDCPEDGSPCTHEICMPTGFCDVEPQELPFGDQGCDDDNPCTDEVCSEGACAHEPATAAPDDGNPCTVDACEGGIATHDPVDEGTPCGAAGGDLVCHDGVCKCDLATECGTSTECQVFECLDHVCKATTLEKGFLVDGQDPGDCLKRVCDGANQVVIVPDVEDVPDDPTTGNCKKLSCAADGKITPVADESDEPPDDDNVCTNEGCNGADPFENDPVADGTSCGAADKCQAAVGGGFEVVKGDTCQAGACSPHPHESCGLFKCDAAGVACLGACGGPQDCIAGATCNGTNECEPVAGLGDACGMDTDCDSNHCEDGVCCTTDCVGVCLACDNPGSEGFCSAIANGQDPDLECTGSNACNGQGDCAEPDGSGCAGPLECLSGICEDLFCCDLACPGPCQSCGILGDQGQCKPVPANAQVPGCTGTQACDGGGTCLTKAGGSCGAGSECLSGFCADGVCCNSACNGDCARCDITGTEGTCTNVAQGDQVANCNGNNACDGMNGCKKKNGQSCGTTGECASGFCPDENPMMGGTQGVCCDLACSGTCQSCASMKTGGQNGTCAPILDNSDPDDECTGTCNAANGKACCNGAGACNPP